MGHYDSCIEYDELANLKRLAKEQHQPKSCTTCKTQDGEDCLTCTRCEDPQRCRVLSDNWRDTP